MTATVKSAGEACMKFSLPCWPRSWSAAADSRSGSRTPIASGLRAALRLLRDRADPALRDARGLPDRLERRELLAVDTAGRLGDERREEQTGLRLTELLEIGADRIAALGSAGFGDARL